MADVDGGRIGLHHGDKVGLILLRSAGNHHAAREQQVAQTVEEAVQGVLGGVRRDLDHQRAILDAASARLPGSEDNGDAVDGPSRLVDLAEVVARPARLGRRALDADRVRHLADAVVGVAGHPQQVALVARPKAVDHIAVQAIEDLDEVAGVGFALQCEHGHGCASDRRFRGTMRL